jgi:hypothetical protein
MSTGPVAAGGKTVGVLHEVSLTSTSPVIVFNDFDGESLERNEENQDCQSKIQEMQIVLH